MSGGSRAAKGDAASPADRGDDSHDPEPSPLDPEASRQPDILRRGPVAPGGEAGPPLSRLRGSLRRSLPGLALEMVSVVFAVLVALAVDQWWDGRELDRLVERARQHVEAELRSNRAEVMEARASIGAAVGVLEEAVATAQSGADELDVRARATRTRRSPSAACSSRWRRS